MAPGEAAPPVAPLVDQNCSLLGRVDEAVKEILAHREFKAIKQCHALAVDKGGSGSAWGYDAFKTAMAKNGVYTCYISPFWWR